MSNLAAEDNESRATAQAATAAAVAAATAAAAATQSIASAHITPPNTDYHHSFSPTPTPPINSIPMVEQTSNERLSFDSQTHNSNRTSIHAGGNI